MLIDGTYVMIKGKYIGPEIPGPWRHLFLALNINVFKLGPFFCFFGVLWTALLYGLFIKASWVQPFGIILSVLSLWYLPLGTVISVIAILILWFGKI